MSIVLIVQQLLLHSGAVVDERVIQMFTKSQNETVHVVLSSHRSSSVKKYFGNLPDLLTKDLR